MMTTSSSISMIFSTGARSTSTSLRFPKAARSRGSPPPGKPSLPRARNSDRLETLLREDAGGAFESIDRALSVGQCAAADEGVDNCELRHAAAHGLWTVTRLVRDGMQQDLAMRRER